MNRLFFERDGAQKIKMEKPKRIIRTRKNGNYFRASNEPFNDSRLSWGARGIMGYLLSKPDHWQTRRSNLVKRGPDCETKIRNYLAELSQHGYLRRFKERDEKGQIQSITEIYESPSLNPEFKQSLVDGGSASGLSTTIGQSTIGQSTIGQSTGGESPPLVITNGVITESVITEKVKTDGTDGESVQKSSKAGTRAQNDTKTAAAAAAAADNSASILNALFAISKKMHRPLQSPELLIKGLLARGETPETITNAWKTCQVNAYKPAGAFICWIKSAYLPQQTTFNAKNLQPTPPSSAPPPPPISGPRQAWAKRMALLAQIEEE